MPIAMDIRGRLKDEGEISRNQVDLPLKICV